LGEPLWRQRFERGELRCDDAHQRVEAFDSRDGAERVALLEPGDEPAELVKNELEPQLTGLVNDDEQQLVGMLGGGAEPLQRQKLLESEVLSVSQVFVSWLFRWLAQNVATPSAAMSSTRIVSVVKNGSP
jgi:hypothetical protein